MKTTLKNTVMALGLAGILLNGCTEGDKTPPAPVEQVGTDSVGTCTGVQVSADHERVQIKVNCQDADGIDLYGETGHPAPYIDIQGFQQALSSIPEEHITRNADGIVIAVVDWQVMGYFSSNYSTTGKVVMWSVDGESGEYKEVESVPFAVQTAQAPVKPTPPPKPTNHAPTCDSFTVNALGDPTFTTSLASKIHDADPKDTLTVKYEGSGRLAGTLTIDNANTGISGTDATIIISNGDGTAYIDYTVSDGTDRSAECRVTFTDLVI